MYVRVSPWQAERLVKVSLANVHLKGRGGRLLASRGLRERRWDEELCPENGYLPSMEQRLDAFDEAVELQRAALYPKRQYYISEHAFREVLGA